MLHSTLLQSRNTLAVGLFLLFSVLSLQTSAELAKPNGPQNVVYRIESLTVSERDALVRTMQDQPDVSVEFSCVPAGIIVVKYDPSMRNDLVVSMRNAMNITTKERIQLMPQKSLAFAEQQCANARNNH